MTILMVGGWFSSCIQKKSFQNYFYEITRHTESFDVLALNLGIEVKCSYFTVFVGTGKKISCKEVVVVER